MFKGSRHNGGIRWRKQRSWDLFFYLSGFIASELRAFIKYNINSTPHSFYELDHENGHKLWHEAVEKMYWSFKEISEGHPNSPFNIAWEKYWNEYGQYRKLEDWTYEKDGHTYHKSDDRFVSPPKEEQEEYNNKVKEGLHLFAEHFEELWD